jgi:subtilisin family serine protease
VVYRTEFDNELDIPLDEMDGRTRPSSLAALGAARRNVLVVAAMGNLDSRQSGPSTLSVPGDADSILAVGIVNPQRELCGYSTTGPTADGRIKPELVSVGPSGNCAVQVAASHTREALAAYTGTSFAAPAVAAVAALLRQAKPQATAQEIRADMLRTATNASAPDSRVGWGVARAWSAFLYPDVSVRRARATLPSTPAGALFDAAGRRIPTDAKASSAGIRYLRAAPRHGSAADPGSPTGDAVNR